jgi:hypothetical protein
MIRRAKKEMLGWRIQYLEEEKLWYLTKDEADHGIIFEGWYYTTAELLTDLNKYINK